MSALVHNAMLVYWIRKDEPRKARKESFFLVVFFVMHLILDKFELSTESVVEVREISYSLFCLLHFKYYKD